VKEPAGLLVARLIVFRKIFMLANETFSENYPLPPYIRQGWSLRVVIAFEIVS